MKILWPKRLLAKIKSVWCREEVWVKMRRTIEHLFNADISIMSKNYVMYVFPSSYLINYFAKRGNVPIVHLSSWLEGKNVFLMRERE